MYRYNTIEVIMHLLESILTPVNNHNAILYAIICACLGLLILTAPHLSTKISFTKALTFCLTILVISLIVYTNAPPQSILLIVATFSIAGSSFELIKNLKQIKEKL